jgi:hypothetical protein
MYNVYLSEPSKQITISHGAAYSLISLYGLIMSKLGAASSGVMLSVWLSLVYLFILNILNIF